MVPHGDTKSLRCGMLAKAVGVSPDTIRHYEKIGVLPKAARTSSGYRLYPDDALERVRVIQRALRIGFTLAELSEIFKTRDAGGVPCKRVFSLAQQKLANIEEDIVALQRTRKHLRRVLLEWEQRMGNTKKDQRAHLLHSLTDVSDSNGPKRFGRRSK